MIDTASHPELRIYEEEEEVTIVKRKTNICYCVLKLAAHGELYKMLECTEKFSEELTRSLFV